MTRKLSPGEQVNRLALSARRPGQAYSSRLSHIFENFASRFPEKHNGEAIRNCLL
jgi:hypothetical protein